MHRVPGGFSAETYRVTVAWPPAVTGLPEDLILRRDPPGGPVERDIQREYAVMLALRDGPIPVPGVLRLEMDPSWLERPFFIEEFLPGTADRRLLQSLSYAPWRPRIGEQFICTLACMHTLDMHQWHLDFLESPGTGTQPAAREVAHWEGLIERHRQEPVPLLKEAFIWLKAHLPPAPRVSLVHGEYRAGNFLFEDGRIIAILDWEYAHLGDPVEDLGWAFAMASHQGIGTLFFPREEFLDRYAAQAGFAVGREALRFWEVVANVKTVAILMTWQHAFRLRKLPFAHLPGSNTRQPCADIARLIGL